jgi:hypothetical protein
MDAGKPPFTRHRHLTVIKGYVYTLQRPEGDSAKTATLWERADRTRRCSITASIAQCSHRCHSLFGESRHSHRPDSEQATVAAGGGSRAGRPVGATSILTLSLCGPAAITLNGVSGPGCRADGPALSSD